MTKRIATSRRQFIQLGLGASMGVATALTMPNAYAKAVQNPERRIAFKNLHTGEKVDTVYWVEGEYLISELSDINSVLRDHRTDEIMQMDTQLLDQLHQLQQTLSTTNPFEVISAYRSPQSNAELNENSSGVAKKSLHMQGRAIDIRLSQVALADLHGAAKSLKAGGVGRYSRSGFIHLDTGTIRSWGK
jgi:uncharacterized protein YcbK (DUF882 family)